MKNYIFLTIEGYIFEPDSEWENPDVETFQFIGFAQGNNPEDAFCNLIKENQHLIRISFDEVFSYELNRRYEKPKRFHHFKIVNEVDLN